MLSPKRKYHLSPFRVIQEESFQSKDKNLSIIQKPPENKKLQQADEAEELNDKFEREMRGLNISPLPNQKQNEDMQSQLSNELKKLDQNENEYETLPKIKKDTNQDVLANQKKMSQYNVQSYES